MGLHACGESHSRARWAWLSECVCMRWKPQLGKVGVVILVCAHASCWKQAQEDSKPQGGAVLSVACSCVLFGLPEACLIPNWEAAVGAAFTRPQPSSSACCPSLSNKLLAHMHSKACAAQPACCT